MALANELEEIAGVLAEKGALGERCFGERFEGEVVESEGDYVTASFKTPQGELEQTYDRKQFGEAMPPRVGDRITVVATVYVSREDRKTVADLVRRDNGFPNLDD